MLNKYTGQNDKIVTLEKTTWCHFCLRKTVFFFCFFTDHLLVGQWCTNPKSNRSLLSCLKVTQCSTSEIGDALLYNSCSLPIQVMTTGPLPAPSKCKSRRFNAWGHSSTHQTTLRTATVMFFSVVSNKDQIMPPHIFDVGLKVNTKVYLGVLKSVVIPWCNQVAGSRPWVWQQDSAPAYKSKETQAWLQKECYDFVPFSHWPPSSSDLNPQDYFVWSHVENITNITSNNTKASHWSPPSTEYSSTSRRRLWKRHTPSSGSVSRRWLWLKAAALNRCQLYYIIKLPDLIFFNKSFKINCSVFFRATFLSFHPVLGTHSSLCILHQNDMTVFPLFSCSIEVFSCSHLSFYIILHIESVSICMGSMLLLITLLIIMLCSFLFMIWNLYTIKTINPRTQCLGYLVGWLVRFSSISTFVGYLTPNPFSWK